MEIFFNQTVTVHTFILLRVTVQEFIKLSYNSNNYFFVAKKVKKEDGSIRLTHDAQQELKRIHEKICRSFFKIKLITPITFKVV